MPSALSESDSAPRLRSGIRSAIATTDDDYTVAVEFELVSLLNSPCFQKSAKSCAFLRYVTEETLGGRGDSLKERTIGVSVLGREPSYDTGADPAVRVRANDVRKRLAAHYSRFAPKAGYRIELPAGSYIPSFIPSAECPEPISNHPAPPRMLLWQLAAPTLVAMFLALIALRGQVESNDAFTAFWSRILANRDGIVVELDPAADGVSVAPDLADAAIWFSVIATNFHLPIHMSASQRPSASDICVIRLSEIEHPPPGVQSMRIGDATLALTAGRNLLITGTSSAALQLAVQRLSSRDTFPALTNSVKENTAAAPLGN